MLPLAIALLYLTGAAAVNDQCLTATPVTCGSSTAGDTKSSLFDGMWDCNVVHSAPQAWFYVDVGTGQLTVSTCNAATTWDTQISIYTGISCDNSTCFDGVDDGCSAGGVQSFISSPVTPGRYYIMVHGFGTSTGTFTLDVLCTVPSPVPTPSKSPSPRSASRSGSPPRTASKSPSPPRSTSPRSASRSASGNPSTSQSPSPLPSGSRSPASRSSSRSPSPPISPAPANEQCAMAIPVTCGTTVSGDTTAARFDGTWDCTVVHSAPQVWYYVDAAAGQLDISLCNAATTWDTQVSVYAGADCANLTCADGVDDGCGTTQSLLTSTITGGRYYIMVHGFGSDRGPFAMNVACATPSPPATASRQPSQSRSASRPPSDSRSGRQSRSQSQRSASRTPSAARTASPLATMSPNPSPAGSRSPSPVSSSPAPVNSQCVSAVQLLCGSSTLGDTTNAVFDGTWDCDVVHSAPQLWYYVDADAGQLQASLCNAVTTWDTQISVYAGLDCGAMTCLIGADDGCGTVQTLLAADVPIGRYYIMVHGAASATGRFQLDLTCTGAVLPSPATPAPAASPIADSPAASPQFFANEQCALAVSLQCGSTVTGDTTWAVSDGTADCTVPHTSGQLWFYVDVAAGQLQASLCNAATLWDTQLSIFSGPSCAALSCVSGIDDGCATGVQSLLNVNAAAGRYYIMVHGYGVEAGSFAMDVTCNIPSPAASGSRSPLNTKSPRSPIASPFNTASRSPPLVSPASDSRSPRTSRRASKSMSPRSDSRSNSPRSPSFSSSPAAVAVAIAVNTLPASAATMSEASPAAETTGAYYAALAVLPVVAVAALLVARHHRRRHFTTELAFFTAHEVPVNGYRTPCDEVLSDGNVDGVTKTAVDQPTCHTTLNLEQ